MRALLPVFLGVVGVVFLLYAVCFHRTPVLVAQTPPADQTAVTETPPAQPEEQTATIVESEPDLVREVSVGGVTRLASGEIKRTYTGAPEKACPT
jgi:hypothetical protein